MPKNTQTFAVKKTKKQIFVFFFALSTFNRKCFFQAFATSEFLCAILSPFYREISNILNHFTILLRVSALLLVWIKIKFQFKNVQLLEFVFFLLFLDYYQSKTINLRVMQCCFMCWLVHKSHCSGERIKIQ